MFTNNDNKNDAPRCIGVKLADGRSIFVSSDSTNSDDEDDDGAVICTHPLIKVLVAHDGSSDDLNLTGADWYRLPHTSLAYDEMDPNTREIKFGIIGAETLQQDEYDYITSNNEKQNSETPICG